MTRNRNKGGCGSPFSTKDWFAKGRKWDEKSMQDFKFTNQQEIDNYFNHDKLQCLECGEMHMHLTLHLKVHRMSKQDYCKKHNLPKDRGLVGAGTRNKIVKMNKDRMEREMADEEQREKIKERLRCGNEHRVLEKDKQCPGCLEYFRGKASQPKCPRCVKQRKEEYRLKDKDKQKIRSKKSYAMNKDTEAYKKRVKEYYEENKDSEEYKNRQRANYERNYSKYYEENKDKIRKRQNEYHKKYYKENKDKLMEKQRERRKREKE